MALGAAMLLFGSLTIAAQGNELLMQSVITPNSPAARNVPADCRKDEAEQEGVSVDECELMVANVKITIASRPSWFRDAQRGLAFVGTLAGLTCVLAGFGLADNRHWAPTAAVWALALLLTIDAVGFATALYTGPLLRAVYLWNIVLWASIHLCLIAGALAGRRVERAAAIAVAGAAV